MPTWITEKENITFVIAVIGFVISIYNFVYSLIQNHTRIKISVPHVFHIESPRRNFEMLHIQILNLSKNPVVISKISVKNTKYTGSFGAYRRELFSKTIRSNGIVVEQKKWFSDQFPVKIEGGSCVNLLLAVDKEMPAFAEGEQNVLKVHTAQRVIRYKLFLSSFSEKELLEECREPN